MLQMIPEFDFDAVLLAPWREEVASSVVLVSMAFLVTLSCGLIGVFLLLRRVALMGDVLSHSLLPGIVVAFLWSGTRDTGPLWLGALIAGMITILLVEGIQRFSRLKSDAAMGIVFSTLFALGVVLISVYARNIDLDAECVLYGELLYIILEEPVRFAGLTLGPMPLVRMMVLTIVLIGLLAAFYKELLSTSFDSAHSVSLGISARGFHYALLLFLSVVIVSVFEAVGAILVVAMLVFPGATGLLLGRRLSSVLLWTTVVSLLIALLGFHLGVWLEVSLAACMSTMAMVIFTLTVVGRWAVLRLKFRAIAEGM
jgi:manganese/zinc/iron transport system permease protein